MINSHGELMINHDDKSKIKHNIVLTVVALFSADNLYKRGGKNKHKKSKNDAAVRAITQFACDCAHLLALKPLTQSHDLTVLKTDIVWQ